jgi:hypothetical protein
MLVIDPVPVRDRLRDTVPDFRLVGLAADLGRVSASTVQYPSAFVIALGEQAGENRYQSCDIIDQSVTGRIGVIMAVRDIADRSGAAATGSLKALREAVKVSLSRFIPEPGGLAYRFVSGQLQSGIAANGALFWQDNFILRFDQRIQLT